MMELIRVKGTGLITPKHIKDEQIFQHCSNGLQSVTEGHFDDRVALILTIHSIAYSVKNE